MWLGLLSLYILAGTAIVPNHGDEATLIFMAQDFHEVYLYGNLRDILFNREAAYSDYAMGLRLLNGTVSKNVYGFVTASNGLSSADINEPWNWMENYESNVAQGRIPQSWILHQARLASATQLALAVALFFQFTRMALGRPSAYLASAFLALHPNMLINGRRAMMEGSHMLGLMLVLLAGIWLLRQRTWKSYALLGVCMGFAVAAKHPNVLVAGTVFCACLLMPIAQYLRERGRQRRMLTKALLGMTVTAVMAALVFLLLNPSWWSAPLDVPQVVFQLRQDLLRSQVENLGGYNSLAEQISGFFQYVFVGERQYFESPTWAGVDIPTTQIAAYERSGLAGLLYIGESSWLGIICLALSFVGLAFLVHSACVSPEIKTLILAWIGGTALFTLLLTPLPWARYYLPLVPALILLVSHALVVLAAWLWKRMKSQAYGVAILA